MSQEIHRKGGKYEAVGFGLILLGFVVIFASGFEAAWVGGLLILAGFVVFLAGRFM